MKITDAKDVSVMHLTYDEELECARKFCTMLDLLWIEDRKALYKPLCRLFFKKSKGWDFTVEEFVEFDDAIQAHNETVEPEYFEYHGLPNICADMDENDEAIGYGVLPANVDGYETREEKKMRYRREVARAWKEAWAERPKGYLRTRYPIFPGDDFLNPADTPEEVREKDLTLEREFWVMVDHKQEHFGCSRKQAILEVTDYMPRAIFEENMLPDPNPKKLVKPLIEMDEMDEDSP